MKIYIKYKLNDVNELFNEEKIDSQKYIEFRLFNIKVFRISLDEKDMLEKSIINKINRKKGKEAKWLNNASLKLKAKIVDNTIKMLKIDKFMLDIGINFVDEMMNAYILSFMSATIPFIINRTDKVKYSNIRYNLYIGDKLLNINFECILSLNIVKNIPRIIYILLIVLKGGKKNGTKTSNRISNGYIYDFN